MPVFVYGHTGAETPFHEEAYSTVVSDRGALLIMTTPLTVGTKLLLTNQTTQNEQQCRVAHVGRRNGPNIEIAIEFTGQTEHFWRLTAPPSHVSASSPAESSKKAL